MELSEGQTFGPYRLMEPAGSGGMADVWRAFDARLNRYVAIKFLSPRYATDTDYLERFRHEARAISRLDHAHILTIYDYGEQDGWTYMVSPFLGGGTLATRLRRGAWTVDEAIAVLDPLASALDYAHRSGIVHRDVKPSNVLFTEHGRLVLSDFGIARILEGTTMLSRAGLIVGTPMYMSPEQADGQPAGPASDLYSLGVIAYEMLTGKPPFTGETPLALLRAHIDKPLPAPRAVNPYLSEEIQAALFTIMAKDPGHRYQTGEQFVEALRRTAATIPQPLPGPRPGPVPPPDPHPDPTLPLGRTGWRDVPAQWGGSLALMCATWALAWITLIVMRQGGFEAVRALSIWGLFFDAPPEIMVRSLVSLVFGLLGGTAVAVALLRAHAITGWGSGLFLVGGWGLSYGLATAIIYAVVQASSLADVSELDHFLGFARRTSTSGYAGLILFLLPLVPAIFGGAITAYALMGVQRRWDVRPILGWAGAAILATVAASLGDLAARSYFGSGMLSTPAGHGLVVGLFAGVVDGLVGGWAMLTGLQQLPATRAPGRGSPVAPPDPTAPLLPPTAPLPPPTEA